MVSAQGASSNGPHRTWKGVFVMSEFVRSSVIVLMGVTVIAAGILVVLVA